MAKTVEDGFRTFRQQLTPSGNESDAARRHRASLEAYLKAKFEIVRFFRTGSFGNGTSVSGYSDVDYFASIPRKRLKQNSATTLREVREVLDARFPRTGVRVSSPAVLVPFGKNRSEWTEVVPADFIKRQDDKSVYEIADGNGGWTRSSPELHNRHVARVDAKLSGKVRPLIRFVKAWKFYAQAPISSFYLELRTAKYAATETTIVYAVDVKRMFKLLLDNKLAAISDPVGVSGAIPPCDSAALKHEALGKLETALVRAEKALATDRAGKTLTAFEWWDKVFFGHFASYR